MHLLPDEPLRRDFRECIYGCELCQDACPFNKGMRREDEDFPGLAELAEALSPEAILEMDEAFYRERVQPKLFYIGPDDLWKWKVDVLNYMGNNYHAGYAPLIEAARSAPDARIAAMARLVAEESCAQAKLAEAAQPRCLRT